jgi:hypothetical protein
VAGRQTHQPSITEALHRRYRIGTADRFHRPPKAILVAPSSGGWLMGTMVALHGYWNRQDGLGLARATVTLLSAIGDHAPTDGAA